jgi:GNAT superfamily N-acetyltransferase
MNPIDIREAVAQDLPGVLALYAQPEIDNGQVLSLEQARELLQRFQSYPNYKLYVACSGADVLGSFTLLIVENLAHLGASSGLVEDVVVAVAHQRKGIGKQMMKFALDRCREAGCYKMALSSSTRRVTAHRFYESLGFLRHGYSFLLSINEGEP